MVQAKAGITEDVSSHMLEHSKELSKARKKRVMPAGLATAQEIEAFSLLSSHPLHKSTKVACLFWQHSLTPLGLLALHAMPLPHAQKAGMPNEVAQPVLVAVLKYPGFHLGLMPMSDRLQGHDRRGVEL